MATLRGRAAQPLRPGLITKAVLSADIPLYTGEFVTEASITDLHKTYKHLTTLENATRSKDKKLRGMTYRSYVTMFKFAQLLELVVKVREEPMLFPPPGDPLLSMRKEEDEVTVVESKRIIFRLTQEGLEDEVAWTNLCRAWIEKWPIPQKAEVPPPTIEPPIIPPKVVPPKVVPPIIKELKLVATPSVSQFRKLLAHLNDIKKADLTERQVRDELYKISGRIGDWEVWNEDALDSAEEADDEKKIEKFSRWKEGLTEITEGFLDEDIDAIISSLEKII